MENTTQLQGWAAKYQDIKNNTAEIKSTVVKHPGNPFVEYLCEVGNLIKKQEQNCFYLDLRITYTSFFTSKIQMVATYSFEIEIQKDTQMSDKIISWRVVLLKHIFDGIHTSTNSSLETKGFFPVPTEQELIALNETAVTGYIR